MTLSGLLVFSKPDVYLTQNKHLFMKITQMNSICWAFAFVATLIPMSLSAQYFNFDIWSQEKITVPISFSFMASVRTDTCSGLLAANDLNLYYSDNEGLTWTKIGQAPSVLMYDIGEGGVISTRASNYYQDAHGQGHKLEYFYFDCIERKFKSSLSLNQYITFDNQNGHTYELKVTGKGTAFVIDNLYANSSAPCSLYRANNLGRDWTLLSDSCNTVVNPGDTIYGISQTNAYQILILPPNQPFVYGANSYATIPIATGTDRNIQIWSHQCFVLDSMRLLVYNENDSSWQTHQISQNLNQLEATKSALYLFGLDGLFRWENDNQLTQLFDARSQNGISRIWADGEKIWVALGNHLMYFSNDAGNNWVNRTYKEELVVDRVFTQSTTLGYFANQSWWKKNALDSAILIDNAFATHDFPLSTFEIGQTKFDLTQKSDSVQVNRSNDFGVSWDSVFVLPNPKHPLQILTNSNGIYLLDTLGQNMYLWCSLNTGLTWLDVSLNGRFGATISADYLAVLKISSNVSVVQRTQDSGLTWETLPTPPNIKPVALQYLDSSLYVLGPSGASQYVVKKLDFNGWSDIQSMKVTYDQPSVQFLQFDKKIVLQENKTYPWSANQTFLFDLKREVSNLMLVPFYRDYTIFLPTSPSNWSFFEGRSNGAFEYQRFGDEIYANASNGVWKTPICSLKGSNTPIDTIITYGQIFQGILIQQDTLLLVGMTDLDGCDSTISYHINADSSVLVTQDILGKEVQIFPNPFRGQIQIQLPKNQTPMYLSVKDVTGQVIYQNEYIDSAHYETIQLATQTWPQGVYFLYFQTDVGLQKYKIIKQ